MNFSKLLMTVLLLSAVRSQAADIGGITMNGEAAFDFNFLSAKNAGIPGTEFAPHETYRFNKAQVLLKKETEQVAFLGRLVHTAVSYDDANVPKKNYLGALEQLEFFYKINPQFQVGFGRFLTTMGYESLMRYENTFYNNTIAYQNIVPGYGEGLRAKYIAGDWLTATLSTYNQFNYGAIGEDEVSTKTTELSATGVVAGFTWFGGYLLGTDALKTEKSASSVWASYKFIDNMALTVTYDSRTTKADGAHTQWSDAMSAVLTYGLGIHNLGLRYESVRGAGEILDLAGVAHIYGSADKVSAISITDKIALNENLNVYVEFRTDRADEEVFADKDGAATKDAHMITLGALAHF